VKGLDSNVLVRFLVGDDPGMMAKVVRLLETAQDKGETFLVSIPVLLEMLWVLKARYQFTREDVLDALDRLLLMPVLRFQAANCVRELVQAGRSGNLDLADILIGLYARDLGCDLTLTFDRKASKSSLFRRIH
jgi:predicted nucleic-acid-binding protein